jgi:hypothetical protein
MKRVLVLFELRLEWSHVVGKGQKEMGLRTWIIPFLAFDEIDGEMGSLESTLCFSYSYNASAAVKKTSQIYLCGCIKLHWFVVGC